MRALVVDPAAPHHLRLSDSDDPASQPHHVQVAVAAASLNYGEVRRAGDATTAAGTVLGWDAAGVVTHASPTGDGPAVGSRVLTRGDGGGWATLRSVHIDELAEVPEQVELGVAAALPVAGGTALRALRHAGPSLGRRVLVTGAAGGVGRFAVQLAALGGAAEVVAQVGSEGRAAGLRELGATAVVIGDEVPPADLDIVIDTVGGPQLAAAYARLAPGGIIESIGGTAGVAAVLPPYATVGGDRCIHGFSMGPQLGRDLAYLLDLVARGQLRVDIGWRGPWERVDEAVAALLGRQVAGKAVIDIA